MKYKNYIKILFFSILIMSFSVLLIMCEESDEYNPVVNPVMHTTVPINITSNSAELTAISLSGGGTFSEISFYYIEDIPIFEEMDKEEIRDYILENGQKVDAPLVEPIIQKIEGLTAETNYWVISYGRNEKGESIGSPVVFTTNTED